MSGVSAGAETAPPHSLSDRFTAWDGALVAVLAAFTFAAAVGLGAGKKGEILSVRVGESVFSYPLGQDGVHILHGPLGDARLVVRGGMATLQNAHCPMRVCEAMGAASHPGDAIVCVPNRIVVSVKGKGDVDAVSR